MANKYALSYQVEHGIRDISKHNLIKSKLSGKNRMKYTVTGRIFFKRKIFTFTGRNLLTQK